MDYTEKCFYWALFGFLGMILLLLAFAVIHDTRPQCWFSRAPFVCEEVYKLKEQKDVK